MKKETNTVPLSPIHVDRTRIDMPRPGPFVILAYNIETGIVRKIKVEIKDGTLVIQWLDGNDAYRTRQAERHDSQEQLVHDLNEELRELQNENYILAVSGLEGKKCQTPGPGTDVARPRTDKANYYLDIAETVASRSTCLRRRYGAIIVKDDQIIATGYNGAPRGLANCSDLGYCARVKNDIPHGERYEQCRAIHAEMNAIISAPRTDMIGQTLYLVGLEDEGYVPNAEPCLLCTRCIVNAGIGTVVIRQDKTEYSVLSNDELMTKLERNDCT